MRAPPPDDERVVIIEKQSAGVGSFLLGLGLGAAAALLLAPRAGSDTRRQLSRRAQDAGGTARRRAQGLVDDVSTGVTDQFERARSAVEMRRHQVQRAVEAGRVAAAQAREDLERRLAETKAAYQAGAVGGPADRASERTTGRSHGVATGGYEPLDDDGLEG